MSFAYIKFIKAISSLGPATHCTPPPNISNAEAAHRHSAKIGENVLYACKDGFYKIGGDSRLSCHLSKNYAAIWSGTRAQCVEAIMVKGKIYL